jgi:hypothetical protein
LEIRRGMRELVEVTWINEDGQEPVKVKEMCFLLHFGVRSEIINDGEGRLIGVSNTVAIVQNCKTGDLNCFAPEQIRVIGTELKR